MTLAQVAIATNNGDIGGGEVMLFNIADALRSIGIEVTVIGPDHPGEVVSEALAREYDTVSLKATNRVGYMAALASWRLRHQRVPLWCNGLVPSVATAGIGPRIVHLHVVPTAMQARLVPLARSRAARTLVPSRYLASWIPGSAVLENWTTDIPFSGPPHLLDGPLRLGFLGRHSPDKGLDVLLEALALLPTHRGRQVRLVLAGDGRFATDRDRAVIDSALRPVAGRVDRIGWIDREDFFGQIDLAVFPSVARETFGLVAAEAMAFGTPFVVSADGALQEVVGPEHPWTARIGDSRDLQVRIRAALDAVIDGSAAHETARARARWVERFSPRAGRRRVAEALLGLAGRHA